ncbi:MAG: hypothetical protein HYY62_05785 [Deltaproteobacteria bacterium]|nr:hypothetical protein [Deltaproteobacteria bacterium]
MKKVLFFTALFLISVSSFATQVPTGLHQRLISKAWNGFLTTDEGANGYKQITLNFTNDESHALTGMVTIYGVKVGNGIFNPSEFLDIDYWPTSTDSGYLLLSYLDPVTRIDRDTYTLKATHITDQVISGLLYLKLPNGETFKIGTFRVQ